MNLCSPNFELVRELVICNMQTNLGKIHKTLFQLSCPQVNVSADANADTDADDAELQLQ